MNSLRCYMKRVCDKRFCFKNNLSISCFWMYNNRSVYFEFIEKVVLKKHNVSIS